MVLKCGGQEKVPSSLCVCVRMRVHAHTVSHSASAREVQFTEGESINTKKTAPLPTYKSYGFWLTTSLYLNYGTTCLPFPFPRMWVALPVWRHPTGAYDSWKEKRKTSVCLRWCHSDCWMIGGVPGVWPPCLSSLETWSLPFPAWRSTTTIMPCKWVTQRLSETLLARIGEII